MIAMHELVDLRMQQHIAHEIYRQQIMQRIPDPFPTILPMAAMQPQLILPTHQPLPDVEAKLANDDLWQQFHKIGTEMIITKTGRRMFPSMRLSVSGLNDESNYCVLLEMVPIGDCRYKFSGSQWVPAGGAEPQSPQRMYLHPDSPASGAHWKAQPILFNKVKLTNNTLDSSGHIVLASMHKYQPRIHVIRTSDLSQIPWAPQQAFVFPETEFVAVTAYQNDRITKLKIDNNPFAKGFRETGQSRCKRKMSTSPTLIDSNNQKKSHIQSENTDDDYLSLSSKESQPHIKRMRSNGSTGSTNSLLDESYSTTALSPLLMAPEQRSAFIDFSAHAYYPHSSTMAQQHSHTHPSHLPIMPNIGTQISAHLLQSQINYMRQDIFSSDASMYYRHRMLDDTDSRSSSTNTKIYDEDSDEDHDAPISGGDDEFVDVVSTNTEHDESTDYQRSLTEDGLPLTMPLPQPTVRTLSETRPKSFSISSILGGQKEVLSNFS